MKSEKQSAHSDYIRSVAFSPDGKTIVSGSEDGTIKVWDAGDRFCKGRASSLLARDIPSSTTGTLELKSEKQSAHSSVISSVAFSPDGKAIVSGSYDETIKVWDAGA